MSEDEIRRAQGQRLVTARIEAGYRSARDAAISNQWPESTYRAHEAGKRTIGQDDAEKYAKRFRLRGAAVTAMQILFPDTVRDFGAPLTSTVIPIMGFIGAGEEIEPDYEQVPPEGLAEVELPFPVAGEMVGFQVRGDSM